MSGSSDKKIVTGKVALEWLPSQGLDISQIYLRGLEYALVNEKNQQCHHLVYCKDFIQDAVYAFLHSQPASIYGFSYDPAKYPPLDLERTRVLVVNESDQKFATKIPSAADFVNQFCKKLGLRPTQALEVSNPPDRYRTCGAFVFVSSGVWQNSPVLVSMFSLFLRIGFVHKVGDDCQATILKLVDGKVEPYQSCDREQMSSARKGVEQILQHGYRTHFYKDTKRNYPARTPINTMHNSTGIVAFATGATQQVVPYWTRKSIGKKKTGVPEAPEPTPYG